MFKSNKYTTWYYAIVNNARGRIVNGYSEIHHIIPRSLGGNNEKDNLVTLTAKEHFMCHLLLVRMVDNDNMRYKMTRAAMMMLYREGNGQERYKTTSRIYESLKKSLVVPTTVRLKMSQSQTARFKNSIGTFSGKMHTEETRYKMSQAASKPKSDAWKESASQNRKGRTAPNKGIPQTEQTKRKISQAVTGEKNPFFGKTHTQEQRQRKREEKLSAPKQKCPYCSKEVDGMNYARWHGEKCKSKS